MGDNEDIKESVYKRYLKGDIMERKLAYRTAKGQIIDLLKQKFALFIKKLEEEAE